MGKLLNPRRLWSLSRASWAIVRGGGPKRVHLRRIEGPDGYILLTSTAVFDVETDEGEIVRFEPTFILSPLFGWPWRLARWAGAPLVGAIDGDDLGISIPVPGRS